MKYPIKHLPNPPSNWRIIGIAIYAGSGMIVLSIAAIVYCIFR